jgi:hypothetical protein
MAEPIPQLSSAFQTIRERGRDYIGITVPALLTATIVGTLTAWYTQVQTNVELQTRLDRAEATIIVQEERIRKTEDATQQLPALATELSNTTRGVDRLLNLQLSRSN